MGVPVCARAQPNGWKLGAFLSDQDVVAMFVSDVVKSLTFKDALDGTNISKAQAVDNSENWELTQPDHDPAEALDMLPASNDDFAADMVASQSEAASSPGSSASHAATPAKRTRRG